MHLSNQAMGAIMMALQESLLHQLDIVPILQGFDIEDTKEGLIIKNPPTVRMPLPKEEAAETASEPVDTDATV
jgi:hypothetical protein